MARGRPAIGDRSGTDPGSIRIGPGSSRRLSISLRDPGIDPRSIQIDQGSNRYRPGVDPDRPGADPGSIRSRLSIRDQPGAIRFDPQSSRGRSESIMARGPPIGDRSGSTRNRSGIDPVPVGSRSGVGPIPHGAGQGWAPARPAIGARFGIDRELIRVDPGSAPGRSASIRGRSEVHDRMGVEPVSIRIDPGPTRGRSARSTRDRSRVGPRSQSIRDRQGSIRGRSGIETGFIWVDQGSTKSDA